MLLNAKIHDIKIIHPGLAIFQVAADDWQFPEFKAGQYVTLGLPCEAPRCIGALPEEKPHTLDTIIRRAYSIASANSNSRYLEFYINLVPSGELTPRLFALNIGDSLFIGSKITGIFTIDQIPLTRNLLFIATGTGLAPYMSMIRSHLLEHLDRKLCILHGARNSWELGYKAQLRHLQTYIPNFAYHTVISKPESEPTKWHGNIGYVSDLIDQGLIAESWHQDYNPENTSIFLCGNPLMIESMNTRLEKEGFTHHTTQNPGNIHVEKYW